MHMCMATYFCYFRGCFENGRAHHLIFLRQRKGPYCLLKFSYAQPGKWKGAYDTCCYTSFRKGIFGMLEFFRLKEGRTFKEIEGLTTVIWSVFWNVLANFGNWKGTGKDRDPI